ncbi:MAG: pyruvate dehydrogenase (acetyl-transferring), homodimeric type [Phaeodactylibacter sp.]|nr:pyruvate dehydrogenase (acetyl-transferring), homodimeric type [Phaeodactylibacter sp.]
MSLNLGSLFRASFEQEFNLFQHLGKNCQRTKIYNAIRWNAMAIVARANKKIKGIGGHISTYSSASTLWEVGFHHFFHSYGNTSPGLVYFQGHASPGLYARSYVEHRFEEAHLDHFRREVNNEKGLSSYPHPRLMPGYWRFPTVSMGLAPIQAIYQARFQKYLRHRGLLEDGESPGRVWAMLGDGEMDEPESTGAITLAAREKLDNLTFVINCNLQRLDGPVRGNTKVISELEGLFRGAGWTVIKVIWGGGWDELFHEDKNGALLEKFNELPDGELQRLSRMNAGEMREEFFTGELQSLVEDKSDEELDALARGGHDFKKIYNAYRAAADNTEGPTIVLAQTVKGWEQGEAGEASNVAHKTKKVEGKALKAFRDRLGLDIPDKELEKLPYLRFEKESEEFEYLMERRKELGGPLPQRKVLAEGFEMPDESIFEEFYKGSGGDDVATTMAFVKMLSKLLGDEKVGRYIVPIIPDESRTFGMDALFREVGIYAPRGQQYEPVDKDSLLFYNESESGAILEEGITEAGAMSSFIASGTNHITHPFFTIPFFAFYSMFGFQRVGDLIWAAADARARGFLIGGISGRTSLSGEGLQHTDGQSHLYAMAYPNVMAYDPAFAFELAHIIRDGLKRMYADGEDIMYYITLTNQAYPMPEEPKGAAEGLLKGLYRFRKSKKRNKKEGKINLIGSGAVMTEVLEAAGLLEDNYGFPVDVWSATSYKALYDDARDTERRNMRRRTSDKNHIEEMLDGEGQVFVAATDYVKALPLSIAQWIPGDFAVLGADGFGRSDTVKTLRRHFEVDAIHIAYHALYLLVEQGKIEEEELADFAEEYELAPDKENPAKY